MVSIKTDMDISNLVETILRKKNNTLRFYAPLFTNTRKFNDNNEIFIENS